MSLLQYDIFFSYTFNFFDIRHIFSGNCSIWYGRFIILLPSLILNGVLHSVLPLAKYVLTNET